MKILKSNSGQSLIELITCISILSIISLVTLGIFTFTTNIYYENLRDEKSLFEYRLIAYQLENTIKGGDSYELGDDLIIYSGEKSVNINNYVGNLSKSLTKFEVKESNGLFVVDMIITVQEVDDKYRFKIMSPPKKI